MIQAGAQRRMKYQKTILGQPQTTTININNNYEYNNDNNYVHT